MKVNRTLVCLQGNTVKSKSLQQILSAVQESECTHRQIAVLFTVADDGFWPRCVHILPRIKMEDYLSVSSRCFLFVFVYKKNLHRVPLKVCELSESGVIKNLTQFG